MLWLIQWCINTWAVTFLLVYVTLTISICSFICLCFCGCLSAGVSLMHISKGDNNCVTHPHTAGNLFSLSGTRHQTVLLLNEARWTEPPAVFRLITSRKKYPLPEEKWGGIFLEIACYLFQGADSLKFSKTIKTQCHVFNIIWKRHWHNQHSWWDQTRIFC